MQTYVIMTDSTTDITKDMVDELELVIMPLQVTIDGESYYNYLDERGLDIKKFYGLIRAGKIATTNQVNVGAFSESFEEILKSGKDILYIAFSSGLSGTYNSAKIAAGELSGKYPERKIIIIDSLSASMGEGLLVYYAAVKKREGMSIDEVANWVEKNKLHLCHWFTVDDLFHLKNGGRVSATAAVFGTMLNIKPVLHVDDEGHLIPVKKVRGRKQSLEALVEKMQETCIDPENNVVFISHGDCQEDAELVASLIKSKMNVKDIKINTIGPVIGSHAGPGTIALFFMGDKR